jgi:hypothetical protein
MCVDESSAHIGGFSSIYMDVVFEPNLTVGTNVGIHRDASWHTPGMSLKQSNG